MSKRAKFIAEVSSNHHRNLARCFQFIDEASRIGCDAVKFQLFRLKELFAPEVLAARPEVRERERWELPVSFLPDLATRCRERKIAFSCTPFYLDAVDELLPHVDFYKVASYELLWDDLLKACAQTDKPLVLSTGMATMDEIEHAVGVIRDAGCRDLTLLHCVSGYPAPVDQCNLAAIETIRTRVSGLTPHPFRVGWSDHSVNSDVIRRAIDRWGASMIEFHLDLEGSGDEFKTGHCWLPEQMRAVIEEYGSEDENSHTPTPPCRHTHSLPMDGTGIKEPAPAEQSDRDWRADPSDGLRPMRSMRDKLKGLG